MFYQQLFAAADNVKIGLEWERFGVFSDSKKPVGYLGERGYEKIMEGLIKSFQWKVEDEENGHPFTLVRDKTRITTEGDGKPEISGAPFISLFDVEKELQEITKEIDTFSNEMQIQWIPLGLQPYHTTDEIPLAPKNRYQRFLTMFTQNKKWMSRFMKAVCGLHINIDATSEKDLIKKSQTLFRLSPLLCGVFANSPLEHGKTTGLLSTRRERIFHDDSFGREILPGRNMILSKDFTLEKWIYAFMQSEMIVLSRQKKTIPIPPKTTFLDFLQNGIAREKATFQDLDVHIKTHWVDMRPRMGYIEFRALDSLPLPETMAVSAFLKGILSSEKTMEAVQKVIPWEEDEFDALHEQAWTNGAKAKYKGENFADILTTLMPLVEEALRKIGTKNINNKDESTLLSPMREILMTKITPAEQFLRQQSLV